MGLPSLGPHPVALSPRWSLLVPGGQGVRGRGSAQPWPQMGDVSSLKAGFVPSCTKAVERISSSGSWVEKLKICI